MTTQPIPKAIYDKAKGLGITEIVLRFSGGNDEGHLYVETNGISYNSEPINLPSLVREIEDWAWKAYEYNGAGDGTDYGDDITYNLESNEVSTQEWYHVVEKSGNKWSNLEIAEEDEE
jgi:hypothetical protein